METVVFSTELDDLDGAVRRAEEAIASCEGGIGLLSVDPRLEELRLDARFPALLQKAGLAP
ncbi:MAG: hypothetical protein H7232_10660 [Aeromicrobium sp.]|nr:hypothetical protein [Burkholderiales bacterium]